MGFSARSFEGPMYPLPKTAPPGFNPKAVLHYVFDLERESVGGGYDVRFKVSVAPTDANTLSNFAQYVENITEDVYTVKPAKIGEVPYGFRVEESCWVILQLGTSVQNWRFAVGNSCVKSNTDPSRLFCLKHHVIGNKFTQLSDLAVDNCRVLIFGVSGFVKTTKEYINIFSNFSQITDGYKFHCMPVIFDPDVKNSGDP